MNLKRQKTQKPKLTREPLQWLFVAFFADGSSIVQEEDDKCYTRDDGTGSTFTDVLARESELSAFELRHIDGDKTFTVDLLTGVFTANGIPFVAHGQYFEPDKYELKLVYFRETQVKQDVIATVQDDMSIKQVPSGPERHFVNRYFIGWETTVNGKNKQQTIAVG